jgi:hypothetical protein
MEGMNKSQISAMQARIGVTPDGFWGPKSIAACQKHLRSLMPKKSPWPKSAQASLKRFYGDPGLSQVEQRLARVAVPFVGIEYDGRPVSYLTCHKLVAESLLRVLSAISLSEHAPLLKTYAGIYNHRPMRGGTSWSLHAFGAAIDLDPGNNGNQTHWPSRATMPLAVMEMFAREGWLPAGAFWSRDSMHFQATQ